MTISSYKGKGRVIIENVSPEIDDGRYPIKRVVGESVSVEADIFVDGHDALAAILLSRKRDDETWNEAPMHFVENDRWQAKFKVADIGIYDYTIEAWVDPFTSWLRDLRKRLDAGQDVSVDLILGADLVNAAAGRASGDDARLLTEVAALLRESQRNQYERADAVLDSFLSEVVSQHPDRSQATVYTKQPHVVVDRQRARFSTWYEIFPRSASSAQDRHGTFTDVEARLPYIKEMGFDVLYLPPIHPIGQSHRKGRNNNPRSQPNDVGSPWAIGGSEGGHTAIHPELGTGEDFRRLVRVARVDYGIDIALDIAFQCSPDHPYVKEHPQWFRWRPDGSIQYAENPPKKYEDIYPLNFDTDDWENLWEELKNVFLYWIDQGVHIFRVDNPHTKPLAFWEWVIAEIKHEHPDVIFLSEAFTRPKVMYSLAKLGFTQSYTYFPWRNARWELEQYFTELTRTDVQEFFGPNHWLNTPDILTEYLQTGGRPAFMARLVLAATLGASYGMYGPAFELMEATPRERDSEEYANSEKYEVRQWEIDRPDNLASFIGRINAIRRDNESLQKNQHLVFHPTDNDMLICYSKSTDDDSNVIIVVVNLDPRYVHSGWVELRIDELRLEADTTYQVHDLLTDTSYEWYGARNFVKLDPQTMPAHVFRLDRHQSRTTATSAISLK